MKHPWLADASTNNHALSSQQERLKKFQVFTQWRRTTRVDTHELLRMRSHTYTQSGLVLSTNQCMCFVSAPCWIWMWYCWEITHQHQICRNSICGDCVRFHLLYWPPRERPKLELSTKPMQNSPKRELPCEITDDFHFMHKMIFHFSLPTTINISTVVFNILVIY